MIIVNKATGSVSHIVKGTQQEWLAKKGLAANEVNVYGNIAAYEASTEGQARNAEKVARRAERATIKGLSTPEGTLEAMYNLYEGLDTNSLDPQLVSDLSAYAVAKGLTDKTV